RAGRPRPPDGRVDGLPPPDRDLNAATQRNKDHNGRRLCGSMRIVTETLLAVGGVVGFLSFLCWVAVALRSGRAWDCRPVAEDEPPPLDPTSWPSVRILVPARNEAAMLPRSLPALLAQDYPGEWRVVVVDDRSTDGSAEAVSSAGASLLRGAALPEGWAGKVWALQQGAAA